MLLLSKYFISWDYSLEELKNKFFKNLMIIANIKTRNFRTLLNNFLLDLMKQINEATLRKLKMATSIY